LPQPLRVDPVDLHVGSDHVAVAAQKAAVAFTEHESALAEAESGWVGASREALREFTAALANRHASHLASATALGETMTDAAIRYTNTDIDTSEAVVRVADAMGM
jgi:hypothetical protein